VRTAPGGTTAEKKPSSIERIQRLEKLEWQRLEEKECREERRRQIIAGVKPSGGRHDLVDRIERVTKYPMALLGMAWLIIAIVVLTTDLNGSASILLVGTLFLLWAILLVEYLVRLAITPDRRGYLKRRWAEPATVVVGRPRAPAHPLQTARLAGQWPYGLSGPARTVRVPPVSGQLNSWRSRVPAARCGSWRCAPSVRRPRGSPPRSVTAR
jgi:hypothetical protein